MHYIIPIVQGGLAQLDCMCTEEIFYNSKPYRGFISALPPLTRCPFGPVLIKTTLHFPIDSHFKYMQQLA